MSFNQDMIFTNLRTALFVGHRRQEDERDDMRDGERDDEEVADQRLLAVR